MGKYNQISTDSDNISKILFEGENLPVAWQSAKDEFDLVEEKLSENYNRLRSTTTSAYESYKFITTDVLMNCNGYFEQYYDDVDDAIEWVQLRITDDNKTDIVGAAVSDPTDEACKEEAFKIVQHQASEYALTHTSYSGIRRNIFVALVCNEIIGFSVLEPLWQDDNVTEIMCNGAKNIQVEIGGRIKRVPGCTFKDTEHLRNLIKRLYEAINKSVSRSNPIVDGRLKDKSRLAVVDTAVAPDGPNFNIRKHRENFIDAQQLIDWGSGSRELFAFLGNLVYKQCSILILGGTSSGKTTLLGALSGFIRPTDRVLTAEDNLELQLASNKLRAAPMEIVNPTPDNPNGGVSMRNLVQATLRLRPMMIIVGEVRDGAAYDLLNAFNTGHYGMSTVHANNEREGIYRLTSLALQGAPTLTYENILPMIAAGFDFIVKTENFAIDGSRKITSISEVASEPKRREGSGDLYLPTRQLWRYNVTDNGRNNPQRKVLGNWEQTGQISSEKRETKLLDLEEWLTFDQLMELTK